jgi:hypothetical protein
MVFFFFFFLRKIINNFPSLCFSFSYDSLSTICGFERKKVIIHQKHLDELRVGPGFLVLCGLG